MKQLFVFNDKESAYTEELHAIAKSKNSIHIKDITIDYLQKNKIAVVVSNGLPKKLYYTLKGLNIVTITIGNNEKYIDLADIVIDYKHKDVRSYFSGEEYSFVKNKNIQFLEIGNLITPLKWDSDFFGFPVALVSCRQLSESIIVHINQYVKNNKLKLLQYLCNCHDRKSVKIAEKYGFNFVDIRLEFGKNIEQKEAVQLKDNFTFGIAQKKHIPALEEAVFGLYKDSRYFFDGNFELDKINEFFRNWIMKGVLGTFDDVCYCIFDKKIPVAFCTISFKKDKKADIGILGLASKYQGKGLGIDLLKLVFNALYDKGFNKINVVTQGRNYGAQRLYQKTGFLTERTEMWYHKWF